MIRGLVKHEHIGPGDHHLGEHAADLLASGQDAHFFHPVLACEKHPAQEAAYIGHVLDRGILGQPVHDDIVIVEFGAVVLGEIRLGGREPPFVAALVRLHLAGEDLEEHGLGLLVGADEGHFVLPS